MSTASAESDPVAWLCALQGPAHPALARAAASPTGSPHLLGADLAAPPALQLGAPSSSSAATTSPPSPSVLLNYLEGLIHFLADDDVSLPPPYGRPTKIARRESHLASYVSAALLDAGSQSPAQPRRPLLSRRESVVVAGGGASSPPSGGAAAATAADSGVRRQESLVLGRNNKLDNPFHTRTAPRAARSLQRRYSTADALLALVVAVVLVLDLFMLSLYDPLASADAGRNETVEAWRILVTVLLVVELAVRAVLAREHLLAWLQSFTTLFDALVLLSSVLEVFNISPWVLTPLRVFRLLVRFRNSKQKALRVLIQSLLEAVPMIVSVLVLFFLVGSAFSIAGVELFAGVLRNRCVVPETGEIAILNTPCGGAFQCPTGLECRPDVGTNLYDGFASFDDYWHASLLVFQCVTLEGWTYIAFNIQDATSRGALVYFVLLIFVGSFVIVNLLLAALTHQYAALKRDNRNKHRGKNRARAATMGAASVASLASPDSRSLVTRVRSICNRIVNSPYFVYMVAALIVVNTIFLAIDHHNISKGLETALETANIVLVAAFGAEVVLKLVAMGLRDYARDPFNLFDVGILLSSILELALSDGADSVATVFRSLRLLRIFKLARSFTLLHQLLDTIRRCGPSLVYFFGIFLSFWVAFALIGMHTFGGRFPAASRAHYDDMLWSLVTTFQILTLEGWDAVLYQAISATDWSAAAYFGSLVVLGAYVLLNLFLAIILDKFSTIRSETWDKQLQRRFRLKRKRFQKRLAREAPVYVSEFFTPVTDSAMGVNRATAPRAVASPPAKLVHQSTEIDLEAVAGHIKTPPATPPPEEQRGGEAVFENPFFGRERIEESGSSGSDAPLLALSRSATAPTATPPTHVALRRIAQANRLRHHSSISSHTHPDYEPDAAPQTPPPRPPSESNASVRTIQLNRPYSASILQSPTGSERLGRRASVISQEAASVRAMSFRSNHPPPGIPAPRPRGDGSPVSARSSVGDLSGRRALDESAGDLNSGRKVSDPFRNLPGLPRHVEESGATDDDNLFGDRDFGMDPVDCDSNAGDFFDASNDLAPLAEEDEDEDKDGAVAELSQQEQQGDSSGGEDDDEEDASRSPGPSKALIPDAPPLPPMTSLPRSNARVVQPKLSRKLFPLLIVPPSHPVRLFAIRLTNHPFFEWVMLLVVLAASVVLALETPDLLDDPDNLHLFVVADGVFGFLFLLELILRVVATDLVSNEYAYFRSQWNRLEAFQTLVSLLAFVIGVADWRAAWGLRVLRCLRPLRLIRHFKGMKIAVMSLLESLPQFFNATMITLLIWGIFAILGVQLFKGKFFACNDPSVGVQADCRGDFVGDDGLVREREWSNPPVHFDNFLAALLALFEVASLEGWLPVMYSAVDIRGVGLQPERDSRPQNVAFFLFFIIIGSFFAVDLFVGVVVDTFDRINADRRGFAFLTPSQIEWVATQRLAVAMRPVRIARPPGAHHVVRSAIFRIVSPGLFDALIMACVAVDMVVLAFRHDQASASVDAALLGMHTVMLVVFAVEMVLRPAGLGWAVCWQDRLFVLDLAAVVGAWVALATGRPGAFVVALRLFRIVRVLPSRWAVGLQHLARVLAQSVPPLINVGSVLFLFYYVFAVLGVHLFSRATYGLDLDRHTNFGNWPSATVTLMRISTGENWNYVMRDAARTVPVYAEIYFLSFMTLVTFVSLNLFVAVIVQKYDQVSENTAGMRKRVVNRNDFKRFNLEWATFDPTATGYVPVEDLAPLLRRLGPPFGLLDSPCVTTVDTLRVIMSLDVPLVDGHRRPVAQGVGVTSQVRPAFAGLRVPYAHLLYALTRRNFDARAERLPDLELQARMNELKERALELDVDRHQLLQRRDQHVEVVTTRHYVAALFIQAAVQRLWHLRRHKQEHIAAASSALVVCGPVIGKVSSRTARVLIEIDRDAEVTCTMASFRGSSRAAVTRNVEAFRPTVFVFEDLAPATRYKVTVEGVANSLSRSGSVRTLPVDQSALNVVMVACHKPSAQGGTDLWAQLRDQHVMTTEADGNAADMLVHIGDQVYADEAFAEGMNLCRDMRAAAPEACAQAIVELYREIYRRTWNQHACRTVLSNVPNLCIWDDHEIRNDFGSYDEDRDRGSDTFFVASMARVAYHEYQRQLWDDMDDVLPGRAGRPLCAAVDGPDNCEASLHVFGSFALLLLDQRGGRTFGFEAGYDRPFLGRAQWELIEAALASDGTLANVQHLVLASTIPLVYTGHTVSQMVARALPPMRDKMGFGLVPAEQQRIMELVRLWRDARSGRDALLVAGDMHCGSCTHVFFDDRLVLRQVVTSPICNRPLTGLAFAWYRALMMAGSVQLGHQYSYRHLADQFVRDKNYLFVRMAKTSKVVTHRFFTAGV